MTVYFISGLGADKRVFDKLSLPAQWKVVHLEWIAAFPHEQLIAYVNRFSQKIDQSEPFCLVGLSFGGIVAIEIAKILQPQRTIIISSIETKDELPLLFKTLRITGIHKLVPATFLNKIYPFTDWYFSTKTKDERLLVRQIIRDTSPVFVKWALNEIMNWDNTVRPKQVYHIHGTKDNIFPYYKVHADYLIQGGGHFMIYSKAELISALISQQVNSSAE
ncbi:MAG: alpha/beta hydrolase [Bacteroidota bacterium]|nr:alpha/beta hydrolase [Bacteroidota bacterium]